MMNQIRNPNEETGFIRLLSLVAISLGAMAACWWAAGNSLGLFFGGLFAATFLTPAAVLESNTLARAIGGLAAVLGPVAIMWVIPILKGSDTPGQWVQSVLVLAAYSSAIGGIALVLERVGGPVVFAAAVAIIFGLAWLTWPVWLSSILVRNGMGEIVQHLVAVHPPLAINGILTNEPAWTERSLAYHLTNLNQDVPIRLPANAAACAALHGILGLALWTAAIVRRHKSVSRMF
jgi:hypothetical protein